MAVDCGKCGPTDRLVIWSTLRKVDGEYICTTCEREALQNSNAGVL
jgi:hypothetical protein